MMEYYNTQINRPMSNWAHQMIENMSSQTSFLEDRKESLTSSRLKEARERESGNYASKLIRRQAWSQLFRKGWNLLFNPSQRQCKDPGTEQQEIHFGEILERDKEGRETILDSSNFSERGTGDNKSLLLWRGRSARERETPSLKVSPQEDKLLLTGKDQYRLVIGKNFRLLEILGTRPRMTLSEHENDDQVTGKPLEQKKRNNHPFARHPWACFRDLRPPEDAEERQTSFRGRERHQLKRGASCEERDREEERKLEKITLEKLFSPDKDGHRLTIGKNFRSLEILGTSPKMARMITVLFPDPWFYFKNCKASKNVKKSYTFLKLTGTTKEEHLWSNHARKKDKITSFRRNHNSSLFSLTKTLPLSSFRHMIDIRGDHQ